MVRSGSISGPLAARRKSGRVEPLEPRRLFAGGPTPAAHWAFDEGAGTTAADSSGNGHTATLGSAASWVTGNVGSHAIALNGTAAAVVTATGPVVNTAASFTASAWADLASTSGYQTVLSVSGTNVSGFYLQLRGDTGTFGFARLPTDATGTATLVSAPTSPATGTWYHLVGVDDVSAGTLTLYVDGRSAGTVAYAGGWAAGGNTLVGHGLYGGQQVDFVNGSVDDVELFASALSAAQVAALDQPAAYPFDEGTGTTSADASGNGNPLALGAGGSWAAGRIGPSSLAVNGTAAGNATRPTPAVNTALPFSVSAWVNLTATAGNQTFVSIDGANTSGFYLQLRADTGRFAFARLASDNSSAPASHADATAAPTAGTWYNLVGVNDVAAGQLRLYVNGVLQSSAAYANGWQATGATVVGGGKFNGTRSDFAAGDIDDVRFYDSPLSAADAAYIGTAGGSVLTVNTAATGATVSPTLFGAFMEDINYGGEGGVYDDEVRNSGFNDSSNPLNAWTAVAGAGVADVLTSDATTGPTAALKKSGRLAIASGVSAAARAGVANTGYYGVAVAPSTAYAVDLYAKASAGFTGPLTVDLESSTGTVWATATIPAVTTAWAEYKATLTTTAAAPTTATNELVVSTNNPSANGGTLWLGATYLYPPAYQGKANHLRVDLLQKLAGLKPAVFRVPGGNYLEGNTYADRFNWSTTIGPVQNRPGHYNSAWGYWSTDGLGLDEYLQMAEEVGAAPILAVYAGYTLNGSSDTGSTLANDVTDAVNEIHYAVDPVTTTWGALRAANGHAAPYAVQDVEVGNEDFFSSTYATRYPLFRNAIHAAFPSLTLIATGAGTGGSPYDVIDDHFYNSPQWFESNSGYFDNASRSGGKVFVGEWASNEGNPTNDLNSALGDACWLLGLERNSDLVTMESYAPLWVNVNAYQWPTNLIGFDATGSYGSPSYYAQAMLAANHGTTVVGGSVVGAAGLQSLVTRTGNTYYVTVVNTVGTANATTVNIAGVAGTSATGTAVTLTGPSSNAVNTIANPTAVSPVTTALSGLANGFGYTFPGYSITVLTFNADSAPTVATAAAANPSPATGTTTTLSVLGADSAGEAALTYTWSAAGPAVVAFSANGTNAAKATVATFAKVGTYTLTVTIANGAGQTTTSTAAVTVSPTLIVTAAAPVPAVATGGTVQLSAADQFGAATAVAWSATGDGTVTAAGLFTGGTTAGTATVTATAAGGASAALAITVVPTTYADGTGADTYAVRLSPTNPLVEQIFVNVPETAAPTYTIGLAQLPSLAFTPTAGDGSLTVDFANGSPVPAGGLMYVGGPTPTPAGNALRVAGLAAGGLSFSINGGLIQTPAAAAPIVYHSLQTVEFDLPGGGNLLTQTAQPTAAVALNAGPGANTLNVSGGTFAFAADPGAAGDSLTVNDNAAVTFTAPTAGTGVNVRHLAALVVGPGATATLATAAAAADRTLLVVGSLALTGTARLDVGGNDVNDATPGDLVALTAAAAHGYAGGTWAGPGLTSSAAAADATHRTAVGVIANDDGTGRPLYGSATTAGPFDGLASTPGVLIRTTYYGDANLDRVVDGRDYVRTDAGYAVHATGWFNGDFNYDGRVDGSDYTLIDNAFDLQAAPQASNASATPAAEAVRPATAVVPSPATGDRRPFIPRSAAPAAEDAASPAESAGVADGLLDDVRRRRSAKVGRYL